MKTAALFFFGLFLAGCSTTKVLVAAEDDVSPGFVALLPIKPPEGSRPERTKLLRSFVETELRKKGFLVVEEQLVEEVCHGKDLKCPEAFSRFGVDAIAKLQLQTAVSRNFGLGYADSVTGTLTFEDRSGTALESISHSAQKGGGILFNSGQLVEAIKSQADSFKDSTFEPLAREFAHGIVAKLAPPAGNESRESAEGLKLSEPSVLPNRKGNKVMCVQGTPKSLVALRSGQHSAALREVAPGKYCAALSTVGPIASKPYRIELRTSSGLETEKQFAALDSARNCNLAALLALSQLKNQSNELKLQCEGEGCPEKLAACEKAKKVVYRADTPAGPFTRLGEFMGRIFRDKFSSKSPAVYSVLVGATDFSPSVQPVIIQASGK